MNAFTVILTLFFCARASCSNDTNLTFPEGFSFAAASAAYQVEGAWNKDGKGESIWDHLAHTHPERFADRANGDDAAKSYEKYPDDVQAAKYLGVNYYRFSISWTRIMPTGLPDNINQKGIDYYNKLINELINNGIQPLVTIYHWDLPQNLQNLGGLTNSIICDYYEIFARIVFENFGDRVKLWITFNEPQMACSGYETTLMAPGEYTYGVGPYLACHNMLRCHARAYHMYDKEYRAKQNGSISIAPNALTVIPLNPNSTSDQEAAADFMDSFLGWIMNPIYSEEGDYPKIMKENVARNSKKQGYPKSRLPEFTPEEIQFIKGTADYLAVNIYSINLVNKSTVERRPSFVGDIGVNVFIDKDWVSSKTEEWETVAPVAMSRTITWISDKYGTKWPIFITENGFSDSGELNDTSRELYLGTYLYELLKVIHTQKVNVIGYTIWSLIDNLEWTAGYRPKFGLFYVDFNDPERPRTPKRSVNLIRDVIRTRTVDKKYECLDEKYNAMVMSPKLRDNLTLDTILYE